MHTPTTRISLVAAAALTTALTAQVPQYLVVPAAYATNDAVSYVWVPGASKNVRQQTLVGAAHLTALVGQSITALELRRTAAAETYAGGTADLTVTLSIAPHPPLACSSAFAANVGSSAQQVFAGQVTLPTSPATAAPSPTTPVAWTPDNVIRIAFQQPFFYVGGTLCIDVIGQTVSGQNANWWMADAEFEDISGTVTEVGSGCGIYGGPQHQWSSVARRSLLPGGYAQFTAYGTPGGVAVAVFGHKSPVGVPLAAFGLPAAAGCDVHLATLDAYLGATFVPEPPPYAAAGGRADVDFKIPGASWVLGLALTTQWLDWMQLSTSNAIEWTVANAVPSLDMALVDGDAADASGNLSVHVAHVLRFEYQ